MKTTDALTPLESKFCGKSGTSKEFGDGSLKFDSWVELCVDQGTCSR